MPEVIMRALDWTNSDLGHPCTLALRGLGQFINCIPFGFCIAISFNLSKCSILDFYMNSIYSGRVGLSGSFKIYRVWLCQADCRVD